MNRRVFLMGVAGAAACNRGTPRLNVYNWSDYVAPGTISNFERESGIQVRYGTYESDEELLAKVMTGNSGWDVVVPSNDFIQPMCAMALLQPLRHEWLPNLDKLDAPYRNPPWDPQLQWNVPYMLGVTGILYQKALAPPPKAWANLWDQRLRGKITMLDDPSEVLGACLEKLGYSLNAEDPGELRQAEREAIAQKHLVRAYLNAEVRDQVIAGDVAAAQAWAVTAGQAIAAAPDRLAFSYPVEGFLRYSDNLAILRESRRPEQAHLFINYLLRPDVSALIVKATRTSTPNGAARKLLPADLRDDPVLYPPPEVLARGEWIKPRSSASQRLRDRLWTEIKSA